MTWTPRTAPSNGTDAVLSRTTAGLVFRDSFTRSDGTPGNGWTADTDFYAVADGALRYVADDTVERKASQSVSVGTQDVLVQQTFRSTFGNSRQELQLVDSAASELRVIPKDALNPSWRLAYRGAILDSHEESIPDNQWHTVRVVRNSGASTLQVLRALNVPAGSSLTTDLTEILSSAYTRAVLDVTELVLATALDLGTSAYTSQRDETWVCGREIAVDGVPTGYAVRIDTRSQVTAVGSTVTFDPSTWALPATRLAVLNSSGVEVAGITPDDGVWGGDVYTFELATAVWGARSASTASWGARSSATAAWSTRTGP